MAASLRYRHRVVSEADVAFIRQLIGEHPTASRRQLSKKLCQAWNWVQGNGTLRDMLCRGLMLQLHRAGLIELPPGATDSPQSFGRTELPGSGADRSRAPTLPLGRDSSPRIPSSATYTPRSPLQQLARSVPLPGLHATGWGKSPVLGLRAGSPGGLPGLVFGRPSPRQSRPFPRVVGGGAVSQSPFPRL